MIYEYYRTLFEALCMLAYSLFWRGNRSISVKINNLFVFDYFFQHILIDTLNKAGQKLYFVS